MKVKKLGAAILATTLGATMLFAACGGGAKQSRISFYSGDKLDSNGKMIFNQELFYLNENKGPAADPFVFDNTSRDGYYYISSTQGSLMLYRSKNMMDMEAVGHSITLKKGSDQANAAANGKSGALWAPEYLYDEDDECYYVFFSATPISNGYAPDSDVASRKGVSADTGVGSSGAIENDSRKIPYLGRSTKPEGPYELLDFTNDSETDVDGVGKYTHDLNAEGGKTMTAEQVEAGMWGINESGKYTKATLDNYSTLYQPAYPQSYAKYSYLDPTMNSSKALSILDGITSTTPASNKPFNNGFANAIDLHPYIDPTTGYKYLYWTINSGYNFLVGVQMKVDQNGKSSWLDPDWDTYTVITAPYFWTVEDMQAYRAEGQDPTSSNGVPNEEGDYCYDTSSRINEGATMLEHNGKYYLTFSMGDYNNNSYQVCQAVADSPLGSFRKLREYENGILLSGATAGSEEVTGTGHHSIVTIGEKMYIYYHTHNSFTAMGTERHGNIDELKWISIKDYQGNPLDVLVVNGPNGTIQPRIDKYATYKNIAENATVKLTDQSALAEGSGLKWLNDGYLSIFKYGDYDFYETYIQETRINKSATFELTLASPSAVRAVMVYNSKNEWEAFLNLSRIELVTDKGAVYYMENVAFPEIYYEKIDITNEVDYISPGAAAFAEFYELKNIKTVRITVEVPAGQDTVGISEIRILGK